MKEICMSNCLFVVNKKKGVVVCRIEDTSDQFINYVKEKVLYPIMSFNSCFWNDLVMSKYYNKLKMPNEFIGIARLGEGDEWNEDYGRRLAYYRAREKYNRSFYKRAKTYFDLYDNILDQANEILVASWQKSNRNQERLKESLNLKN